MPWFGTNWGAACCDDTQIPVPVGSPCFHCDEPIEANDNGFEVLFGGPTVERTFIHLECQMRTVLGSAAHLLKKCSCYGGDWEDPPELTKREAARLAMDIWEQQQGISR